MKLQNYICFSLKITVILESRVLFMRCPQIVFKQAWVDTCHSVAMANVAVFPMVIHSEVLQYMDLFSLEWGMFAIILDFWSSGSQKPGILEILLRQFPQIYNLVSFLKHGNILLLLLLFLCHVPELQRNGKWASHGHICDQIHRSVHSSRLVLDSPCCRDAQPFPADTNNGRVRYTWACGLRLSDPMK